MWVYNEINFTFQFNASIFSIELLTGFFPSRSNWHSCFSFEQLFSAYLLTFLRVNLPFSISNSISFLRDSQLNFLSETGVFKLR